MEAPRPSRARSSCPFKAREPPQVAGGSRPGRGVWIGLSRASPAARRHQQVWRLTDAGEGRVGRRVRGGGPDPASSRKRDRTKSGLCGREELRERPSGCLSRKGRARRSPRLRQGEAPPRRGGGGPLSLLAPGHSPAPLAIAGLEFSRCTGSLGPALPWRPGGPCKLKRVRTVFTPEQLERLEKEFLKQQYLVGSERLGLAATLQLTETQVGSPRPLGAWRSKWFSVPRVLPHQEEAGCPPLKAAARNWQDPQLMGGGQRQHPCCCHSWVGQLTIEGSFFRPFPF